MQMMPGEERWGRIKSPPPITRGLPSARVMAASIFFDMRLSASMVMIISPDAARAPAFRILARFLLFSSTIEQPALRAISPVLSVQRLSTTITSIGLEICPAAARIALRHAPRYLCSLRAGMTIESRG